MLLGWAGAAPAACYCCLCLWAGK